MNTSYISSFLASCAIQDNLKWLSSSILENSNNHDFERDHKHFFSETTLPFSSSFEVFMMLVLYLSMIFAMNEWMRYRKSPSFINRFFTVHNYFLCGVSLLLFISLFSKIIPIVYKRGIIWTMCSAELVEDPTLQVLYYVNYLLKFYELIDTLFLVIKKRPLEFLHVYHHSATFVLCYTQIVGNVTVQWVPILLNLGVHVPMYYYYARVVSGEKKLWWKKSLTALQIGQFVLDMVISTIYWPHLLFPKDETTRCNGNVHSAMFGQFILFSYLLLFVRFYWKAYVIKKID